MCKTMNKQSKAEIQQTNFYIISQIKFEMENVILATASWMH